MSKMLTHSKCQTQQNIKYIKSQIPQKPLHATLHMWHFLLVTYICISLCEYIYLYMNVYIDMYIDFFLVFTWSHIKCKQHKASHNIIIAGPGPMRPRGPYKAQRCKCYAKQSKAMQSKAMQSRGKQSNAKQSKAMQSKAMQSNAKQCKAKQYQVSVSYTHLTLPTILRV